MAKKSGIDGVALLDMELGAERALTGREVSEVEMPKAAGKRAEVRRELGLPDLDDNGLVARFLEGEGLAFPELVERYQTRLLNFIYRTIGDRDRAEDLVHPQQSAKPLVDRYSKTNLRPPQNRQRQQLFHCFAQ